MSAKVSHSLFRIVPIDFVTESKTRIATLYSERLHGSLWFSTVVPEPTLFVSRGLVKNIGLGEKGM